LQILTDICVSDAQPKDHCDKKYDQRVFNLPLAFVVQGAALFFEE
jgi:hypothetical protein